MAEPGDRAVPDRKAGSGASKALDFEPVTRKKGSHNLNIKLFFTLVALTVIGGGGAWYFYGQRLAGGDDGAPIIRAAEGPVKVRPDNPGGMVVPDRDKLVYDRMQGLENRPAERLLPPPEIPLAPPGTETVGKTLTAPTAPAVPPPAPEPAARPTTEEVLAAKPPSPPPPTLEAEVKKLTEAVKPEPPSAKPKTKPAKPETLMARTAKPPKAPAAVYRVQLAAVRTPARAREEWTRLQKKHSTLLGSLNMSLTRADLGTKGVFYRLRAGPLATENAARDLCGELAKRKVGCLIIRPEKK